MNPAPLISVIIPVYNIADSIADTIESVINQSYDNLQIIIVNDGSTDDSSSICASYTVKDKRITLIDKQNEGLAIARQTGLSLAKGEYIHNLDGGDTIDIDTYSLLVSQLEKNDYPDIILFDFLYREGKKDIVPDPYPKDLKSPEDYLLHIWSTQQYNCVWQYIFKRELANNIVFNKEINVGEDALFTSQILYNATSIYHFEKPLLFYSVNEDSMTHSRYSERSIKSILLYPDLIKEIMEQKPEYERWEKQLLALKLQSYVTLISNGSLDYFPEAARAINAAIRRYPDLKHTGMIKTIIKPVRLFEISPVLSDIMLAYYMFKKKIR